MRLIDVDAVRRIVHSVHGDYSGYDFYDGIWWLLSRIKELPTIELPPHGDLIDRDAFIKRECNSCDGSCECVECDCLECDSVFQCEFILRLKDELAVIPAEEDD